MAKDSTHYQELFKHLLPVGPAFPREVNTTTHKLAGSLGQEFARVDGRATGLIDEAIPSSTNELLIDWERCADLPGECGHTEQTLAQRRAALAVKLGRTGSASRKYYIDLAAELGFTVTIKEYFQFPEEHEEDLDEDWKFTWRINAPETTIRYFRVGSSTVGERLRSWGNEQLECVMNRVKPAHTILIFGYGEA
jgi:uncharacterized protein YmfQ (DUF2313 family)